jgi:hypothetical protein
MIMFVSSFWSDFEEVCVESVILGGVTEEG